MKSFILTLTVALAIAGSPAFAGSNDTEPRSKRNFSKHFAGAQDVKWSQVDDEFHKATFTLSGTRAEAYFNNQGDFIGTARNIFYSQLPLVVMQSVGNKFKDAVIIEVKEITNTEGTNYRVVLEQKEKKYTVKLTSFGQFVEIAKFRK